MELWIRSQDKRILQKVDNVYLNANYDDRRICTNDSRDYESDLGEYKSKERALEVLDEIQNILRPRIIYHEPDINYDDMMQSLANNIVLKSTQKVEMELKQAPQIVYQMPKE